MHAIQKHINLSVFQVPILFKHFEDLEQFQ